MDRKIRVVFTQGGKGGVAKTELMLSMVSWFRHQGIQPRLLDFDIENTNKSGLQNFYPEAKKLDVHVQGALDDFFDVCDDAEGKVVLADLGAGAGTATYEWFDRAFEDAVELGIEFTSVGVTNNDAGAVQSILTWGKRLKDRVKYLIVLNELHEHGSQFEYWSDSSEVKRFCELVTPSIMKMGARMPEFQAEIRNRSTTLQKVIDGDVDTAFLKQTKNVVRARSYQREIFKGFDAAAPILLP